MSLQADSAREEFPDYEAALEAREEEDFEGELEDLMPVEMEMQPEALAQGNATLPAAAALLSNSSGFIGGMRHALLCNPWHSGAIHQTCRRVHV